MSDVIAVTGNLTTAPERRDVGGGAAMVTFGLASTERRLENGVWVDAHTNYYSVSVFRALAEHAFASLERGQRVIVVGKVKVRRWQSGDRSGTSVDLEATSLGPDLMFGTASFVKDARGATRTAPQPAADDWSPGAPADAGAPAVGAGEAGAESAGWRGAGSQSDEARADEPLADEAAGTPVMARAGAWAAPGDDPTPF